MNWYNGNIAEAVAKSKANNAIFVVYVEGKDESTTKLTNFINSQKIREKLESDDFVAIKIESDSQSYMQFATIYQVVPVPSIFFIGKSGTPLEIGTGIIASVEELEEKINKVLTSSGRCTSAVHASSSFIEAEQKAQSPPASSTVTSKNEPEEEVPVLSLSAEPSTSSSTMEIDNKVQHADEQEIVCDGGVCYKKPKETKAEKEIVVNKEAKSAIDQVEQNEMDAKVRLEETRRNMEEQRRKRLAEEKQLEKEHELRRKQERKEFQNAQEWQRQHELKELKDNIRREKLEEMAARERIRAQIAGDRAERAQKFASIGEGAANANAATTSAEDNSNNGGGPLVAPDSTRIQFRFASGNTATHVFNCQDTLGKLREYVRNDLLPGTGIKDFTLATTYPKRELNVEHDAQTLAELNLFPSAVILIIGKESKSSPAAIIARSGGLLNMFTTLVMTILSPVFSIFGYIKNITTGDRRGNDNETDKNVGAAKRANEENGAHHDAAKRRNMERFGGGGITAGSVLGNNPSTSTEAATEKGETKPYRRYGSSNIHRLTDHKDSDDENATWNGNSTQQQ
ncbi:UBX domain-containing protein 4 [Rhagoletis pomonella]|uniref:UBX domain-containing protein 4 n=1 Tax=Rhagoletis pomonella TaxID=28610 RepID=UPI00178736A8|nr:UBX domain-containing protein 4 [Rhagoletis pomonella]